MAVRNQKALDSVKWWNPFSWVNLINAFTTEGAAEKKAREDAAHAQYLKDKGVSSVDELGYTPVLQVNENGTYKDLSDTPTGANMTNASKAYNSIKNRVDNLIQGVPDAVSALGSGVNGVLSMFDTPEKAQQMIRDLSGITANEQNLSFQKDNLEYQKALQQTVFDREDTSYQRTVNDMRQAGMNPLAMNGVNNAGSVISTSAPQASAPDMSQIFGVMQSMSDAMFKHAELKESKRQFNENNFLQRMSLENERAKTELARDEFNHTKEMDNKNYRLNFNADSRAYREHEKNLSLLDAQIDDLKSTTEGKNIQNQSNRNWLDKQNEAEINYKAAQTAKTLADTVGQEISNTISQNDAEFLESHDLSTFSPDFIKTLRSIKDVPDSVIDDVLSKSVEILRSADNTYSLKGFAQEAGEAIIEFLNVFKAKDEDGMDIGSKLNSYAYQARHPFIYNITQNSARKLINGGFSKESVNKFYNDILGLESIDFVGNYSSNKKLYVYDSATSGHFE